MVQFKIFVLAVPSSGHFNPLIPIFEELNRYGNMDITFYLTNEFKEKIISAGVKYKPLIETNKTNVYGYDYIIFLKDLSERNKEYLANEIDRELPDLIVYDSLAYHFWSTLEFYNKSHEQRKLGNISKTAAFRHPFPRTIRFSASFISSNNVESRDSMNIITVLPELQPNSHLFDRRLFKFVGSTSINFSNTKFLSSSVNEAINSILRDFPIRVINKSYFNSDSKLIYASLGTVFNNDLKIFKAIIDGLRSIDGKSMSAQSKNLRVIISTGDNVIFEKLKSIQTKEGSHVPDNILVVRTAPQVEILQRASMFITHSGMNSTSEAIYYAVPMVCIPIGADQPSVAYRIADELGLGIRLSAERISADDVRHATNKILSDISYEEKARRFAHISRQYNGKVYAASLISQLLHKQSTVN